jgi:hypothetical protein
MTPRSIRVQATLAGPPFDGEAGAIWLLDAFSQQGGVLGCAEVSELMRSFVDQPVSRLARWIVSREIVTIVHRSALFLPMFQFDRGMDLQPQCREAVIELSGELLNAEIAWWFVAPNCWLAGSPPVQALQRDPDDVVKAARAERFIRCGW